MKHGLKRTMTAKELYDYFEEAKRILKDVKKKKD